MNILQFDGIKNLNSPQNGLKYLYKDMIYYFLAF